MSEDRKFNVSGTVIVYESQVRDWIRENTDEEAEDYADTVELTEDDYRACAEELFEKDEVEWCESEITAVK